MFILYSITLIGCGGGGGGGGSSSSQEPNLTVLPADFNFGIVTINNFAESLEVTIQNTGIVDLDVTSIVLSDTSNFDLNLNAGKNPCDSNAPTITAGSSCTATVNFTPTTYGTFSADLTIQSNDPNIPMSDMKLMGSKQDITAVNVTINEIKACPRPSPPPATIYVSVIDQGGFPVVGLDASAFAINEAGTDVATTSAVHVSDSVTLSVALLMDYSGSVTQEPDNVTDMVNAVSNFINELGINDEAEIIKFASTIEVTQAFTSDKALLTTAVQSTPNLGKYTALYDAVVKAVDDISASTKNRKAIILLTDGKDDDGNGNPLSVNGLDDVIADANAKGVPVFTVGLGDLNEQILQQMAADTGGTYFDSSTSDNLTAVYKQLASLLFTNQYILTYPSGLVSTATGELTLKATYASGISGSDTKTILACP
jgi:VWFA-related protein